MMRFTTDMKNLPTLIKLIIRRDRIRIPLWIIAITFFTLIVPIAFDDLYGSEQESQGLAETMANPAMTAMIGEGNLENYTIGAMTSHQMLLFTAIVVGLMNILLLNRHTRVDEEEGRIELIRSLPVGRLTNLNAALLVLIGTNIILALVNGFGLYMLNIESMDLEGSLLYGAALGGTGIVFAGITAICSQLSESSRTVVGYAIGILLFTYLLRAIGDVSADALSYLSPLGWVTKTESYWNNNWWPIFLMIGFAFLLFVVANYLNSIRDLGAGFISAKSGKERASFLLKSPLGHAFRLQRNGTISWAIGLLVIGLAYGSVLGDLEAFFSDSELLTELLVQVEGYSLTEQFIPMLMVVMGILATVPPVMAMLKLISEEKKNRLEQILATPTSRGKLMGSYLLIAILNGFVMISVSAVGLWAAGTVVMDEPFDFTLTYGAAMIYYPALLVMVGVVVLLIGFLPKLTSLVWAYLIYSFLVVYLGSLLDFPEWVAKLSPFGYIPQIPVEDMDWAPLIVLILISFVFFLTGFVGYRKRDLRG